MVQPPLADICCWFLIGQEKNRRLSTCSEWILCVDLVIFFLSFAGEFTRISFDVPALKVVPGSSVVVGAPTIA